MSGVQRYRANHKVESLSAGAREILLRTETMLLDLDDNAGPFFGLQYGSLKKLLDLPFFAEIEMPPVELYDILRNERLSLITGCSGPVGHFESYQRLCDQAALWRNTNNYEKELSHHVSKKFPRMKTTVRAVEEALAKGGMQEIASEDDHVYRTIRFTFPAFYYGHMHGRIEIRAGSGAARFRVIGGNLQTGDIYVIGGHTELLGMVHYHDFGFKVPEEMLFNANPAGGLADLESLPGLINGICSYYR